jgi:hypothetical protein
MRPPAQPSINFFTRISIEADERRRQLQERTGYSAPRLVAEAFRAFEKHLDRSPGRRAPGSASLRARAPPG